MSEQGFIDAISKAPGDDVNRLIYADWLEDHDKPGRAALIRAVAALRATELGDPATVSHAIDRYMAFRRLVDKEGEKPVRAWVAKCFPAYDSVGEGDDARCKSALTHETIGVNESRIAVGGALVQDEIQGYLLGKYKMSIMRDLSARCRLFETPESYQSNPACAGFPFPPGSNMHMPTLINLANLGHFKDTPILDFHRFGLLGFDVNGGNSRHAMHDFKELARQAPNLRALILLCCDLRDDALGRLAASSFPKLEYLDLGEGTTNSNDFSPHALIDFAGKANMPHLRLLTLPQNNVTPEVVQAFGKAFKALEAIDANGRLIEISRSPEREKPSDRWLEKEGERETKPRGRWG